MLPPKTNREKTPTSIWYADCKTDEQRATRHQELASARPILERLDRLLAADRAQLTSTRRTDYDNPSWACKQAHYNGEIAQIDRVRRIIKI